MATDREVAYGLVTSLHNMLHTENGINHQVRSVSRAPRHMSLAARLEKPQQIDKIAKMTDSLALASGSKQVVITTRPPYVVFQYELPESFWRKFTRDDINGSEIGVSQISAKRGNQTVKFELFDSHPHTLFAGTTGSGKTETIKTSLVALLSKNTPQQLKIGIVDVKRSKYSMFANSAHLVAPIASDMESSENLIGWFADQFRHRQQHSLFASTGVHKLVLVLDEAQDVIVLGEKNTRPHAANLAVVSNLVQQGREYGIHVVIGTLRPSRENLPSILDELGNRFVGKVVDASASANATGLPQLAANKLTAQGDFLHIAYDVTRFQVAVATEADYQRLPRADVQPVTASGNIPDVPEPKSPGRPKKELLVLPCGLAQYHYADGNISVRAAQELGFSRAEHNHYSDFYRKFKQCLDALKKEAK